MGREDQVQRWLQQSRRLAVGDCRVDLSLNEVQRGDEITRVTPKASGVLEVLLFIAGQPASKERLLAEVWRGECPTDDVVTHAIGELRRAFGDDPRTAAYIRTIPRVGYALVADVRSIDDLPLAFSPEPGAMSLDSGPALAPGEPTSPDHPVAPSRTRGPILIGAACVLAVLASMLFWKLAVTPPPPEGSGGESKAAPPLAVARATPVTYLPGQEYLPGLSPDGSLLAYSAQPDPAKPRRIYLQPIEGGTPRPISEMDVEWEGAPVFSPDGTKLLFQRFREGSCRLVVASSLGGGEREFSSCLEKMLTHIDWTPDGKGLLLPVAKYEYGRGSVLAILEVATGNMTHLDYPPGQAGDVQGRYSPDGRMIAFRRGAIPYSDLYVMNADGSDLRQLTHLGAAMRGFDWLPDGNALIFASDHAGEESLWRVDAATGEVTDPGLGKGSWPDIARLKGTIVFLRSEHPADIVEVSLDGQVEDEPTLRVQTSRGDWVPAYSPDGAQFAFVSSRTGQAGVYVQREEAARQVAEYGFSEVGIPAWSPDGEDLVYVVGSGRTRLMLTHVTSGQSRELPLEGMAVSSPVFSPDGQWIVMGAGRHDVWNLWRIRLDGTGLEQLTEDGGASPQFIGPDEIIFMASIVGSSWQRMHLSDRKVEVLELPGLGFWNRTAWIARPEGIYAILGRDPVGIYRHDWTIGTDSGESWQLLEPLDETRVAYNQFSLSPDASHVLYSYMRGEEGDIYKATGLH